MQIDQELTKLKPWLGWLTFFDLQCSLSRTAVSVDDSFTLLCGSLFLDACEHFITTVDFSSHIKSLPTAQHSMANEVFAFSLRLAGHFAGVLGPMPICNRQFADSLDVLFNEVVQAENLWNQACIRAAWLVGLGNALADGHANNRSWLSAHGNY